MADSEEILVSEQVLQVPFNYSAGPLASRFLTTLRDLRRILGIKCAACGRVHVPPRAYCGECRSKMSDWVEVGPGGVLENFTVVHYRESVHPAEAPFVIGIIKLTGADTGLVHLVLAGPDDIRQGMKLRAVFSENRKGHILDLAGFAPV